MAAGRRKQHEKVMESDGELTARRVMVRGIVQGVGFRPHAHGLAAGLGIRGWVLNGKKGVEIHAEGSPAALQRYLRRLVECAPRMAQIVDVKKRRVEPRGYPEFVIRESDDSGKRELLISPDVSTCDDCRREVKDPSDRHFGYPFTNCTNCGPRFTIIRDLPYDRPTTSMAGFSMCAECAREYSDPSDRRFHAQPVACPSCGPQVWLEAGAGSVLARRSEAVQQTRRQLGRGAIVAIKGLGGFHLACDAEDDEAVGRLRSRKQRPAKPLAVMVRDLCTAAGICRLRPGDRELLDSVQAPIVILPLRDRPRPSISEDIAPAQKTLGLMLPYTPLHMMLFDSRLFALVMTSGNRRGLPLATTEAGAREQLGDVADFFLMHDRPIVRRCDDSVVRPVRLCEQRDSDKRQHPVVFRRSRGWAPRPVILDRTADSAGNVPVLGIGGDEKNTFCLLQGDTAFLSQHMGSLRYEETLDDYRSCLSDLKRLLEIEPQVVAVDMHPGYRSRQLGQRLAGQDGLRVVQVQHHHAHHAACLAENDFAGEAVGLVADGTGFGEDGTLWGMEVIFGGFASYRRLVSLQQVPMPGADRAIRHPLRMTLSHLLTFGAEGPAEELTEIFPQQQRELEVARAQLDRGLNSPVTSSCGRLFDAVSAYLGICQHSTYQGRAAIELSEAASPTEESFPFHLRRSRREEGLHLWDLSEFWPALVRARRRGWDVGRLAGAFHRTVARMFVEGAREARQQTGSHVVALSGGVFQNPTLLTQTHRLLAEEGFSVLLPGEIPPNDGGLSLGQALIAACSQVQSAHEEG